MQQDPNLHSEQSPRMETFSTRTRDIWLEPIDQSREDDDTEGKSIKNHPFTWPWPGTFSTWDEIEKLFKKL
jgi:hypothetical protein